MPDIVQVRLDKIILDPRLQMRETMDFGVIDEYAENLFDLPPSRVVQGPAGEMWLVGGWHRWHAHSKTKQKTMPCIVTEGAFADAVVLAAGENHGHGLRRTNEDKRRAVAALLSHEVWQERSDRMIADACHVGHPFVAKIRKELEPRPSGIGSTQRTFPDTTPATRIDANGSPRPATQPARTAGPRPTPAILCDNCARGAMFGRKPQLNCEKCIETRAAARSPGPPLIPDPIEAPAPPVVNCKEKINLACPHCGKSGVFQHGHAKIPLVFTLEQSTPEFQTAWDEWMAYRRERHLTMTERTLQKQLNLLNGMGVELALESIENSITAGWAGVFEPHTNGKKEYGFAERQKDLYEWAKKRDEEDAKNEQS